MGRHSFDAPSPPPTLTEAPNKVALKILTGVMAAGVVAFSGGYLLGMLAQGEAKAHLTPAAAAVVTPSASSIRKTPTSSPSPSTPSKRDFELTVKEQERDCLATIGCQVIYRVGVTVIDWEPFDPDTSYAIRYRIKGTPVPITGTVKIRDGVVTTSDDMVSGVDASATLRASVIDIEAER